MTQPPEQHPEQPEQSQRPEQAQQPNQPEQPPQEPQATPTWPSSSEGESAGASYPPPAYPPQGAAGAGPGYGTPAPAAPPYGPVPQTSNSAIVALVLSIVSWVVCPVIPAIVALVFANKADKEIAASNGWVTGGGLVTASKIVAWINIGLYAGLIAIGLIFFLILAAGGALT